MYGARELPYGVNFTVHTRYGTGCTLLLFARGEKDPYVELPFPEEYKIGDVYSMIVFDLNIEEFEYAYRVDGPYVKKRGLLFDKRNVLLDPYAKVVAGQRKWGEQVTSDYHARVVRDDNFDWGDQPQSRQTLSELVIYELHVRGYTMDPSSGVRHKGTFGGLIEKIPYMKELGINAVELMPIFEFDENLTAREYQGKKLYDYWGYNTVSFFAPNTSYISDLEYQEEGRELKMLIKAFHEAGIEVILDVVFNHTAEGNEQGKIINLKGFDNSIYYLLTPNGNYYNFSGCGNTVNCNHPIVRRMIQDCLRYWTINYRVDGFRFDLASILGRNEDGTPMDNPPLLRVLAEDPFLSNTKLIAEAWDAGGLYQVGNFPAHGRWAEWNGRYRDSVRGFLKGDEWEARDAALSICGSEDLYGREAKENGNYAGLNSCVNFINCHDGFTLKDLYTYNTKHNEMNGWNNTDGMDDNRSWNCGVEGDTDNEEVLTLRRKMIRNACAVLMCSRGTPMFLAGDEFGNTQYGNNNAYCQDNEISWINWNYLEKNHQLFEFFKYMIAFRKRHPILHRRLPSAVCGMDDMTFYDVNGNRMDIPDHTRTFMLVFAGYDQSRGRDDVVCLAINTYWEPATIWLPHGSQSWRRNWYLCANTNGSDRERLTWPEGEEIRINDEFVMQPRTVAVFVQREH
ncbi:MAG: glycogen debranching enzyme [Clostridiales bacterium]|nr:glycogen debranching enzyme [Clostridiales bacterium]